MLDLTLICLTLCATLGLAVSAAPVPARQASRARR